MTEQNDLTGVKEIFESTDWTTVNEYLKLGWRIIATCSQSGDGIAANAYTKYSLAWMNDSEPVHSPEQERIRAKYARFGLEAKKRDRSN